MMLNVKSLREQVYEYLRDQIERGKLKPGASINLNAISKELGISKTPLRDALIQLETEGLVNILPRRGVTVRTVALNDIKDAYEIVGALEGAIIATVFDRITEDHIRRMRKINEDMREALLRDDFSSHYQMNINFHDTFLSLSENQSLSRVIMPFKQLLYDFPRRRFVKEWELRNSDEHDEFIDSIIRKDLDRAVHVMRDVHWSYSAQEEYIRKFYYREG